MTLSSISHITSGQHYQVTDTGCWEWTGFRDHAGYGRATGRLGKVHSRAHRATYILANGPVREDWHIDHLCRNPSCVNPKHLEAVPPAINVRRGQAAKLTMEDAREIRRLVAEGVRTFDIAPRFGISGYTVWQIAEGITWREDLDQPEPAVRPERECPVCGKDISHMRRGKKYCDRNCRERAYYRRKTGTPIFGGDRRKRAA